MTFRIKRFPLRHWELEGVSRMEFNAEGKVVENVDYWNAAELFESFPLLGKVVTLIKRIIS